MFIAQPFPKDFALPVHFQNEVVHQKFVGNFGIAGIAVSQYQGIAFQRFRLHVRGVIAHGISLALHIMVVAGHPASGCAGIFDVFVSVKLPDDLAVPVHLHHIQAILHAVFAAAAAPAGEHVAAGQDFVGHAEHAFPDVDFASVHVHEHCAHFLRLKDGESAPGLFRLEQGDAGGVNCRVAHTFPPEEKVCCRVCPARENLRHSRQSCREGNTVLTIPDASRAWRCRPQKVRPAACEQP